MGDVRAGMRVLAPFGSKELAGIVMDFPESTTLKKVRSILKVLDVEPVLSEEMMKFCHWISRYYISPVGEVGTFSAVPKGIQVESKILYSRTETEPEAELTKLQKQVYEELEHRRLTIKQLENKLHSHSIRSAARA